MVLTNNSSLVAILPGLPSVWKSEYVTISFDSCSEMILYGLVTTQRLTPSLSYSEEQFLAIQISLITSGGTVCGTNMSPLPDKPAPNLVNSLGGTCAISMYKSSDIGDCALVDLFLLSQAKYTPK